MDPGSEQIRLLDSWLNSNAGIYPHVHTVRVHVLVCFHTLEYYLSHPENKKLSTDAILISSNGDAPPATSTGASE